MNKLFNTAILYLVGITTGLTLGLWEFIKAIIPVLATMALWSLVFWLTFNFGFGSVIGTQINFIQAFCFVWMIRVLREVLVNGYPKTSPKV